jgi:hypothetical protein
MKQEEIERIKRMQSEEIRETLCDQIDVERSEHEETK